MGPGRWHTRMALATSFAGMIACAAGGDAADVSFNHWCDKNLCDWTTDTGRIEPVGSWHPRDLAVSFVEVPTQISRVFPIASAPCVGFETLADVEASARLTLELDFDGDGADRSQQLVGTHFERLAFVLPAPPSYQSLKISVRKEGAGRAALAQMRIFPEQDCATTSNASLTPMWRQK